MSTKPLQSKLLVVEGKDEELFFEAALRDHLGLSDVMVLPIGGKTLLRTNLASLVRRPDFRGVVSLGVVRDADSLPPGTPISAARAAFDSVASALAAAGLPVPPGHGDFAPGPPRVGVFVMPAASTTACSKRCACARRRHPSSPASIRISRA